MNTGGTQCLPLLVELHVLFNTVKVICFLFKGFSASLRAWLNGSKLYLLGSTMAF